MRVIEADNETVADNAPFPIPMRGNELTTRIEAACERSAFPIPMRGNEERHRMSLMEARTCFRSP